MKRVSLDEQISALLVVTIHRPDIQFGNSAIFCWFGLPGKSTECLHHILRNRTSECPRLMAPYPLMLAP